MSSLDVPFCQHLFYWKEQTAKPQHMASGTIWKCVVIEIQSLHVVIERYKMCLLHSGNTKFVLQSSDTEFVSCTCVAIKWYKICVLQLMIQNLCVAIKWYKIHVLHSSNTKLVCCDWGIQNLYVAIKQYKLSAATEWYKNCVAIKQYKICMLYSSNTKFVCCNWATQNLCCNRAIQNWCAAIERHKICVLWLRNTKFACCNQVILTFCVAIDRYKMCVLWSSDTKFVLQSNDTEIMSCNRATQNSRTQITKRLTTTAANGSIQKV